MDKFGTGYFGFANVSNNVNYFIIVKSRNTIETWSKSGGEKFLNNNLNFDFTVNNTQAYGANEKSIDALPVAYGVYSGDVNQDGVIDGSDLSVISNDAGHFVSGYVPSDLNSDSFVDGSDYLIADNNAFNFVSLAKP